jgi:hypothetical protein
MSLLSLQKKLLPVAEKCFGGSRERSMLDADKLAIMRGLLAMKYGILNILPSYWPIRPVTATYLI